MGVHEDAQVDVVDHFPERPAIVAEAGLDHAALGLDEDFVRVAGTAECFEPQLDGIQAGEERAV